MTEARQEYKKVVHLVAVSKGCNQKKLLIICATLCVLWCTIISALGIGSLIMVVVSLTRHSETPIPDPSFAPSMYPTTMPTMLLTMLPTMPPTMVPTPEIPQ